MKGPRCDRILAGMTFAVILAALFNVFAKGVTWPQSRRARRRPGNSTETSSAPTAPASESPAATIDATPAKPTGTVSAIEQSVVPDPLASLDPADRVVAEKICDLLAAKSDAIFASKSERMAVESFYQNRTLAPLWLDRGVANARATAVIARLKEADADGLDVSDYRTPNFAGLGPDALAEADLKLTQTVLTFARHLQAGRFPYKRVSQNNIQLPQAPPEPAAILAKIVNAADAGKALDEFSPPHEAYQKLKVKLAEMRAKSAGARPEVADGPVLKHNVKNPDAGSTRASAARKIWTAGRCVRSRLRCHARRSGEEIPAGQRATRNRQSRCEDRQGAQWADPGQADQSGHCEHGTLALVPARPRRCQCDRQPTRLYAQGDAQRLTDLDNPDCDRRPQPRQADAAAERDDEIRHRQSDLERAAIDYV